MKEWNIGNNLYHPWQIYINFNSFLVFYEFPINSFGVHRFPHPTHDNFYGCCGITMHSNTKLKLLRGGTCLKRNGSWWIQRLLIERTHRRWTTLTWKFIVTGMSSVCKPSPRCTVGQRGETGREIKWETVVWKCYISFHPPRCVGSV